MGFFSNRRNRIIEEKIKEIYQSSDDFIDTNIHWEAFEKFAHDHGGKTDRYSDGGLDIVFNMNINWSVNKINKDFLALLYKTPTSEEPLLPGLKMLKQLEDDSLDSNNRKVKPLYSVSGVRNRLDGTTSIQVREV